MPTYSRIDRLLPRHQLPARAQFRWNVVAERRFPPRAAQFVMATIIDLSLDGALIEVPASSRHEVGERVALRFGGVDGQATVRHRQAVDPERGTVRYGIQWEFLPELAGTVEQAVATVRGDDAELRAAWEGHRR